MLRLTLISLPLLMMTMLLSAVHASEYSEPKRQLQSSGAFEMPQHAYGEDTGDHAMEKNRIRDPSGSDSGNGHQYQNRHRYQQGGQSGMGQGRGGNGR